jgi:hypothetical protein
MDGPTAFPCTDNEHLIYFKLTITIRRPVGQPAQHVERSSPPQIEREPQTAHEVSIETGFECRALFNLSLETDVPNPNGPRPSPIYQGFRLILMQSTHFRARFTNNALCRHFPMPSGKHEGREKPVSRKYVLWHVLFITCLPHVV